MILKKTREIANRLISVPKRFKFNNRENDNPAAIDNNMPKQPSRSELVKLYSQFINSGDLCFDVGANLGSRTDIFVELGARVICIEPQPNCVDKLLSKYGENPMVTIVPKGLDSKPGVLPLNICESAETISTFSEKWKSGRFHDYSWEKVVDVKVTSLDLLVKEYGVPAFCKIDVEGFEYSVLKGLSSPAPMISFEFTREFFDDAKHCMEYFMSLGQVEFNYILGETPCFILTGCTYMNAGSFGDGTWGA